MGGTRLQFLQMKVIYMVNVFKFLMIMMTMILMCTKKLVTTEPENVNSDGQLSILELRRFNRVKKPEQRLDL